MSEHVRNANTLFRPDHLPSFNRGGKVRTIPMAGRRTGSRSLMTGVTIIEPGGSIPLHTHNCDESVLVIEGSAAVDVAGDQFDVTAHDTTFIPAETPHRFINASQTAQLRIFWTYASADASRTLAETGETQRVDSEHQSNAAVAPLHQS